MSSAAVQHHTSQQQYQQSPAVSTASQHRPRTGNDNPDLSYGTPTSAATITPSRAQAVPTSAAAAVADAMAQPTHGQYYTDSQTPSSDLPIRTSTQQSQSPSGPAHHGRQHSARGSQYEGGTHGSESAAEWRPSYRPSQDSPAQPGSGRSQRTRQAPAQSRSQSAIGQPPIDTHLPRENSAIINHIVVDDPQSDIARERARVAEARPSAPGSDPAPISGLGLVGERGVSDSDRGASAGQRSRQEHLKSPSHRKEVKFGDYILGQTLGEGEFGKVKMGWKKEGGVQVAIKLIRKESLAGNTTRLPKIYREISILKELDHPNIVRLHEFVETERHMGIILEYASGGELFDYILNHRYLRDPAARRLFAQLVSGVGYLHKKGIVHRDLKLENLLLDRYKNIIITDFGFANTFDADDDLTEDMEHRIGDKDFVKREGLDAIGKSGHRRGDLMQTSCGSPCYAAPELVVSDGLYTGKKVDVWSCGVILYAMLAGYLPFDDDPANPEGDNINLLYKYIVSTPLTFPEYVTPHARDLLRRILVPDPRRRADLFEVARHSWLSEYSHLVGFIGSTSKSDKDIAKSALRQEEEPALGRSASVREPSSRASAMPSVHKPAAIEADDGRGKQRDTKRRTVQVEYVAPSAGTHRGDPGQAAAQASAPIAGAGRTRARADSQGPVEVSPLNVRHPQVLRKEPPAHAMPPPGRASRDQSRAVQEAAANGGTPPSSSTSRPNTRGNLPSRGNSYSQPAIATPTTENAQGRFSQPKSGSGYIISGSMPQHSGPQSPLDSRPGSVQQHGQLPSAQQQQQQMPPPGPGHKRSSTLSSLTDRVLGRTNSRRRSQAQDPGAAGAQPPSEKRDRRYPPVSMNNVMSGGHAGEDPNNAAATPAAAPRKSTDSRRSSFQFLRKNSDAPSENRRSSRRFSFLPNNLSMSSFSGGGGKRDSQQQQQPHDQRPGRPASKGMAFGRGTSRSPSESTTNSNVQQSQSQSLLQPQLYPDQQQQDRASRRRSGAPAQSEKALPHVPTSQQQQQPPASYAPITRKQLRDDGYGNNLLAQTPPPQQSHQQQQHQTRTANEPVERYYTPNQDFEPAAAEDRKGDATYAEAGKGSYQHQQYPNQNQSQSQNQQYRADGYGGRHQQQQQHQHQQQQQQVGNGEQLDDGAANSNTQNIRPQQRKFGDAFDRGNEGSSSGARRVMDFFRRRGRERGARE